MARQKERRLSGRLWLAGGLAVTAGTCVAEARLEAVEVQNPTTAT